jgi:prepilin-type N-terminal cleavage/methylation domain-containing protein
MMRTSSVGRPSSDPARQRLPLNAVRKILGTVRPRRAGDSQMLERSRPPLGTVPDFPQARVSAHDGTAGVTLIELMIVVTLMGLVAGLSYPAVATGVDSLRLRSASNGIVGFLNTAIDRAERRQDVVEIWISPRDNAMIARTPDLGFNRRYELPDTVRILSILPHENSAPDEPRRFLCYPGGTFPRIGLEIANQAGRKRMVSIDPVTGVPLSEIEAK